MEHATRANLNAKKATPTTESFASRIAMYKHALQDNKSESEGGLSDLQKQQIRFGLANDLTPIGLAQNPLPSIALCIDEASRNKDEKWLKGELLAHGINYVDLTETGEIIHQSNNGKFNRMAYVLCKIAGLVEEEIREDLGIGGSNKLVSDIKNISVEQMDAKVKERKLFVLQNPACDWTKEKLNINKNDKHENETDLEYLLRRIYEETGLRADEIFDTEHIPEYAPRKAARHFKSKESRSLKVVLSEVFLVLINPDWKEIERLTKRNKINIVYCCSNRIYNHPKNPERLLSPKMVKLIMQKRIAFQNSPKAKIYPDNYNYQKVLDALK